MIYKKLSSIADIQAGGTPSRTKLEYWNGNIPWIKISNIKEKYVTSFEEEINEDGLNNSVNYKNFPTIKRQFARKNIPGFIWGFFNSHMSVYKK